VNSLAQGARDTLKSGVSVGRCELLDDDMIKIFNNLSAGSIKMPDKNTLLYEITGIYDNT